MSYRGHTVAVVVPAYREDRLIADTIRGIPDLVDHIVVVDDGSPDATGEVAEGLWHPAVTVIRHESNQGVGAAIVTGHRRAIALGADVVAVMAGDNQMDPAYLTNLLDPVVNDGYGFAKGNRFFSRISTNGMPAIRIAGNMLLTFLNKAASGYWNLVDPQNGYTVITRESLEQVPLHKLAKRYEFENDLLIWLNIADVRAVDIPIPARYEAEVSNLRPFRDGPRIGWLLFRGFWRRMWFKYTLWSFSPVALLLYWGLLLLGVGLAVGTWTTVVALQGSSPTAGTTVLSVVPFFCGFVLLVQALVLDIQGTPD